MLLENVLGGQSVTPYECIQLASLILTPTQKLLWKDKWGELCEIQAIENLNRQQGDPRFGVGIEHLMGTGLFATPEAQAPMVPDILRDSAALALRAFAATPETGKQPVSFVKIQQGPGEPFMTFLDRLLSLIHI